MSKSVQDKKLAFLKMHRGNKGLGEIKKTALNISRSDLILVPSLSGVKDFHLALKRKVYLDIFN